ncbi:hypothetical protein MC1_02950 [Rickettsia parkeri str. Portsmouth]|nr:hypothetical protein MC1_02950 [Rickettsia parkeri str. Portsmouth]
MDQFSRCHPARLDHGIQLKILELLVFFIVFMDPVVKPRDDTGDFTGLRNNIELRMTSYAFSESCNNAYVAHEDYRYQRKQAFAGMDILINVVSFYYNILIKLSRHIAIIDIR